MSEGSPAIPAASLILMSDQADGPPLILMVQRASSLVFAAGAYVFPGGRLDPEDQAAVAPGTSDPMEAASRLAALRETLEETGITIDTPVEALVPFARWRPEFEHVTRRFDTRFYLASTHDAPDPVADGTETAHAFWATASEVLARCGAGDGRAIFPTRRILERLARFASFAEACEEAQRLPQIIITPWIDGDRLRIPENAGYPVTSEILDSARRY